MYIESLDVKGYRNYSELSLNFSSSTNIFYGNNAQGKTNVLEAIYVAGTTKSHRANKDSELIMFGEEEAHIKLIVNKDNVKRRIDMHLKKSKAKGVAIDGIPIKKAVDLLGIINIVFFSPEDLNMIKNGPAERRRFIDMELCQLDKLYVHNLVNYNKALNQRNKLLKDIAFDLRLKDTLDIWDSQVVMYGTEIIKLRKKFISELNEIIRDIHKDLSGNKENLVLSYEPSVDENSFAKEILSCRERDLKLKSTSVGPHRDDIGFFINDMDVKKFGSQGQQRTSALSLKLSEIELVKKITKDNPVLLLDDVLSELDSERQNHLLNSISKVQTIITCTEIDEFINSRIAIDKIYRVENGQITE